MDSIIRVVGALSLWSIEIVMQLRVYALYKCSRRVRDFVVLLHFLSFMLPLGCHIQLHTVSGLYRRFLVGLGA